jgi:peroxiredoxin
MTSEPTRERLEQIFVECRDMDASLNERLAALYRAGRKLNPAFADAVERMVVRLKENGAGENAPKPGEPMPPFLLPDDAGRLVSIEQILAKGPVAVMFHRGHWCPYCRISVAAVVRAHKEIGDVGGQVVAIMPDRQEFAAEFKRGAKSPFPVLIDMDNGYALTLNLAIWVGEEMKRFMANRSRDLPYFQGNESWVIPIPATFVVGTDGLIKARFVDPDFRKRMAIEDLIAALHATVN